MSRPRLLDLGCKAGGATRGYQNAGWRVTGVDIDPQPRYVGDHFCQADIIEVGLPVLLHELGPFDAIHASPPCQAFTEARRIQGRTHPDLLTPIRLMLETSGLLWVIENVPGAPMRPDLVLCGSAFGLEVKRHRWFEANWPLSPFVFACRHDWPNGPVGVYGHTGIGSARYGQRRSGNHGYTVADWRRAMQIDWMNRDELSQAIPPAYTEWIGRQLMAHLERAT